MRLSAIAFCGLLLAGCARTPISAPAPDLTSRGTTLTYEVTAGSNAYPFVVRVMENGDAGTAFAFNLADGQNLGTVRMSAEAREAASGGMLNAFQNRDYTLTDQTSVWMTRADVRRMKAGETAEIDLGDVVGEFALDGCDVSFMAGGQSIPACRYLAPNPADVVAEFDSLCEGGDEDSCELAAELRAEPLAMIVALDDDAEPLILDMDTGSFRVTLQRVGR